MFSKRPLDTRGRWLALTAATVVLQFAYWPIVASVVVSEGELAGGLWLGLAVTPLVFLVLAFGSRNPRAPGATAAAMGLFLVVGLSIGLVNLVAGLAAGYGAGAVVALRREPQHGLRARWIAVAVGTVYLVALSLLAGVFGGAGEFALMSGGVIPLAIVGIADEITSSRVDAGPEDETAEASR